MDSERDAFMASILEDKLAKFGGPCFMEVIRDLTILRAQIAELWANTGQPEELHNAGIRLQEATFWVAAFCNRDS